MMRLYFFPTLMVALMISYFNKKGQHKSCHTAKCNMFNKWLKTKTKFHWSLILSLSPSYTSYDLFTHICTNISHTRATTYAHMHICNPPPKSGKIKCCYLANIEYFWSLYSRFVPAEIYECFHLANIMYADALNSIEFCIPRLFLRHIIRHLGICNPICVKLLQPMCAVITHNSVKKRSLYINKWLSYSQL